MSDFIQVLCHILKGHGKYGSSRELDFHKEQRHGPEVIKLFSCSTQMSTKFQLLIKTKIPTNEEISRSLTKVVFIMLINVKMPTIVGI